MSGDAALGIDVGTSGIRAALLSPEGEVLGLGGARMETYGADHRAPSVWARTLGAALEALFSQVSPERVGAVSVDGTSGTVLALDKTGAPVGTALMYNDAVDDPDIPQAIAALAPAECAAHGASSALARAWGLSTT